MVSPDSVTQWIGRVKAGDASAAEKLWQRYFQRLVRFARRKLHGVPGLGADEEDVALSVMECLIRGAGLGRFPQLFDRHDLWPLLATLTARKAANLLRHEHRQKRGGGKVRGESALAASCTPEAAAPGLDQAVGPEPAPDCALQTAEEFQRLLDQLGDERLRSLALWKLEGYTNAEIAAKLGCATVTVERRLRLIRSIWTKGGSRA